MNGISSFTGIHIHELGHSSSSKQGPDFVKEFDGREKRKEGEDDFDAGASFREKKEGDVQECKNKAVMSTFLYIECIWETSLIGLWDIRPTPKTPTGNNPNGQMTNRQNTNSPTDRTKPQRPKHQQFFKCIKKQEKG